MRGFALLLSFGVGFLSLSQEILWVRWVSFGHSGSPHAFAIVLAAFLAGIAIGAAAGRVLCARRSDLWRTAGVMLLLAGAFDLLSLFAAPLFLLDTPLRLLGLVSLIAAAAALKGTIFPIAHHLGTRVQAGSIGRSVSRVYAANVAGATVGPLITGFVLLDVFDSEVVFALIGVATLVLGLKGLAIGGVARTHFVAVLSAVLLVAVFVLAHPPQVVASVATAWEPAAQIQRIVQNKHGIVHVLRDESGVDVTYGNNAYDGHISVDMKRNFNGLDRAYMMAALHPQPRSALVIGLSTGAWARAILGFDGLESLNVIDINPGYVDIMRAYPEVSPVLGDPRVSIHIDDGRRWLRAHPERRFDLIFQNTTFHWRAYTSLLLSADYFRAVRSHLNPGGIFAVNTTRSVDVYRTALEAFPHAVRYRNFVFMSDRPLQRHANAEQALRAARIDAASAFTETAFAADGIATQILTAPLEPAANVIARAQHSERAEVISDLNAITEFRHGKRPLYGALNTVLPQQTPRLFDQQQ